MFSSLTQGSLIHILDKTKGIVYKTAIVTTKSEPKVDYGSSPVGMINLPTFVDIDAKVDDTTYNFKHIPASSTVVNYDNGNITISETKEGLIPQVENLLHNSKQIVDNIQYHKDVIESCNKLLIDLNPQFAKEKEREQQIVNLETKVSGIEDKLDKIINLINK